MSIISRMKKQTCVHWHRTGTDSYGRATWDDPVERACRWEDRNEKYTNAQGEERLSRALVYVDDVSEGDVLLLGSLTDSGLNLTDPLRNGGAWKIERYDSCPNFKNTETLYTAYL